MKPGDRLKSAVCATEVVVIKPPSADVLLRCGGLPMGHRDGVACGQPGPRPGLDGGTALGKRYTDPGSGLVVLCTKGGDGTLSVDDRPLELMSAKPLPASD